MDSCVSGATWHAESHRGRSHGLIVDDIAQKVRVEMAGRPASRFLEWPGQPAAAVERLGPALPVIRGHLGIEPAAPASAKAGTTGNGVLRRVDPVYGVRRVHQDQSQDIRIQREKKAYVKDPKGGPFRDLVRAAEKCTAQVIHPGTPADRSEKDIAKLIKRAKKYL